MDATTYLAQILGLTYLVVGLGILVNENHYKSMIKQFMDNKSFMYFGGVISLIVGYNIVTFHNVWGQSWEVLITIIGWMALLKGFILLVQPHAYDNLVQWMLARMHVMKFITLVLGAVFAYFGFLA